MRKNFGYKPRQLFDRYLDDPPPEELDDRRKRLDDTRRENQAPAPRPINPPQQTAPNPNDVATDAGGSLKDYPQLRDEQGNLNPRYNTSKAQDILAGLAQGAKMGMGQDPFFQFGAVLGGALGGVFNKNIAGYQRYQSDVALTQQENEQIVFKTNAQVKWENSQLEAQVKRDRESRLEQQRQDTLKLREMKTDLDRKEYLTKRINDTTGEDRAFYQNLRARLDGIDEIDSPETYGVGWELEKGLGDIAYWKNKSGEIKQAEVNGKTISTLGVKDFIDIVTKANNLNPENVADSAKGRQAMIEADKILKPYWDRGDFKDSKNRPNHAQYNAQRIALANKMLASSKGKLPEGTKFFDSEININGVSMPIKLPFIDGQNTSTEDVSVNKGEYVTVNTDSPDVDMELYKGVDPDIAEMVNGYSREQTELIQNTLINIKQSEEVLGKLLKDPKISEQAKQQARLTRERNNKIKEAFEIRLRQFYGLGNEDNSTSIGDSSKNTEDNYKVRQDTVNKMLGSLSPATSRVLEDNFKKLPEGGTMSFVGLDGNTYTVIKQNGMMVLK